MGKAQSKIRKTYKKEKKKKKEKKHSDLDIATM